MNRLAISLLALAVMRGHEKALAVPKEVGREDTVAAVVNCRSD